MRKQPKRIALWGNFGTGNWGNECTLQAIVHNARQYVPDAQLFCVCSEPDDTERRHGLRSFPISPIRRVGADAQAKRAPKPVRVVRRMGVELRELVQTVQVVHNFDMVVMTGTGMLTDDAEGPFGLPYDMFKWSLATRALNRKLAFASVGVEPIRDPVARFFLVSALKMAEYRSYRDLQSRAHLTRVGFAAEGDPVYPDLAFSLPEVREDAATERRGLRPTIAVGIYSYRDRGAAGTSDAAAYDEYLKKIATFVMWLLERGKDVRIIIGDLTYDGPVLPDLRVALEDMGIARYRDRFTDEPAASVAEVMAQIRRAEIVVASRFHNVLLGLLLGKPVVSISYNVKNDALMKEMGLSDYCQTLDGFDVDRLMEQFAAIEQKAGAVRAAVLAKGASYRDELKRQYSALFGEPVEAVRAPASVAKVHLPLVD